MKIHILLLQCMLAAVPVISAETSAPVVFMTDFGLKDDAVSQCKAAMYSVSHSLKIFDMTHEVPSFNIPIASFFLEDSAKLWPKNTVFVAVVDPGVGTKRRPIAIKTKTGQYFIGPDNGIFTLPVKKYGMEKAVVLENKKFFRDKVSTTFHGRGIFAPVGAHLAMNPTVFDSLGTAVKDIVMFESKQPYTNGKVIGGSVNFVESYGNIWTDIDEGFLKNVKLGSVLEVIIGKRKFSIPYVTTFGDVSEGKTLAYLNSRGYFSLAVNMGNFSKSFGVGVGDSVEIILPIAK